MLSLAVALASPPIPVVLDVVPAPTVGGFVGAMASLDRRGLARGKRDTSCECDLPGLSCAVRSPGVVSVKLTMSSSEEVPTDPGYLGTCFVDETEVEVSVRLVGTVPAPWWKGTTLVVPTTPHPGRYMMKRVKLPEGVPREGLRGSLAEHLGHRDPMPTGCYLPEDDDRAIVVHLVSGEHGEAACLEGQDDTFVLKVVEVDGL